jgi:quercetin dioxygenase-like cupin family protein
MNGRTAILPAILAALALTRPVAGQGPAQAPPAIVPVEQEPQHHPVFRNDVLAVIDVQFPPGYTSLFHRHSNDNVSVRITTAPTRTDTLTETGTPQTAVVGRLVFNSATPPYVHRVANLGDATIHIIDIEVLATQPTPRAPVPDELGGHEVVVENERVRLSRAVLAAGASLPAHVHPRGWLEVVVRGPMPGSYRWHEPGDRTTVVMAGPAGAEIAEVEVK